MQESSKKARNSSVKQTVTKTQPKTVRVYSKKISDEEFARMSDFFERYGRCRHFFLNRYCGIKSMLAVNNWQVTKFASGTSRLKAQKASWKQSTIFRPSTGLVLSVRHVPT